MNCGLTYRKHGKGNFAHRHIDVVIKSRGLAGGLEPLNKLRPRTAKRFSEAIQIIDRHVPLACLNPLQGAPVNRGFFRQNLLSHAKFIAKAMDIAPDNNMRFGFRHPMKLSRQFGFEGGSICRFYLVSKIDSVNEESLP